MRAKVKDILEGTISTLGDNHDEFTHGMRKYVGQVIDVTPSLYHPGWFDDNACEYEYHPDWLEFDPVSDEAQA